MRKDFLYSENEKQRRKQLIEQKKHLQSTNSPIINENDQVILSILSFSFEIKFIEFSCQSI